MKAERVAEIRGYIERTKPAARNIAIDYLRELITELESRGMAPPSGAEADPGELFRRGHIMLQASPEFQVYSAVALLQSYAETFAHTPSAATLLTRLSLELNGSLSAAELIALKHETEQTPAEQQLLRRRKRLRKLMELARAAADYAQLGRELKEETLL